MMDKKKGAPSPEETVPSVQPVPGEPVDVFEQINKYGTYECQDTADTDNVFPLIGPQGAGRSGVQLPKMPELSKKWRKPKSK